MHSTMITRLKKMHSFLTRYVCPLCWPTSMNLFLFSFCRHGLVDTPSMCLYSKHAESIFMWAELNLPLTTKRVLSARASFWIQNHLKNTIVFNFHGKFSILQDLFVSSNTIWSTTQINEFTGLVNFSTSNLQAISL